MKLIVLVLVAPVVTFFVVSGLVQGWRTMNEPAMVAAAPKAKPASPPSWEERMSQTMKTAPRAAAPVAKTNAVSMNRVETGGKPVEDTDVIAAEPAATGTVARVPASRPPPAVERPAKAPAEKPVPVVATPAAAPSPPPVKTDIPAKPGPAAGSPAVASKKGFTPEEEVWVLDDFERANPAPWDVRTWANPADMSIVGGQLMVELGEGKHDKTAIFLPFRLDMSSRTHFVLDVRNESRRGLGIALAVMTGDASTYFESDKIPLKPGENKDVAFDLRAKTFKCAASGWEQNTAVSNPEAVKSVCILIYGESKTRMFIDNIRGIAAERE